MDPKDHNHRSFNMAMYGIFVAIEAILMGAVVEMTERSQENRIQMGICLATLVINYVAALWLFSQTTTVIPHIEAHKIIFFKVIFIFTGILSPYLAFSVLLPEWFNCLGYSSIDGVCRAEDNPLFVISSPSPRTGKIHPQHKPPFQQICDFVFEQRFLSHFFNFPIW
ncbi:hypothetical protein L1987_79878 [Smallanthus sonchifolius]|uniref:Uncharacterized protein n=1 Tax=Smallanthus sonchifolius TaxID=185202 RepID=A0ACB8YMC4_9ASTR|nr:hypothetical protein L1987_79878 [Smallanthus sonchifolius]